MRNNRGFTLIELLVAVAIFGIITGMSIPLIKNIQLRYSQKKYIEYGNAMVSSAKLYRDSYDEDLFGRKTSGCALIPLSRLIEKGFIKDFPAQDITCDYSETMVRIVKINKQYGYSYQLFCGTDLEKPDFTYSTFSKREGLFQRNDTSPSEKIGEELEEETEIVDDYGSFGGFDLSACNMKSSMKITANPDSGIDKAENYSVKVTLSSSTGISSTNSPINVQYAWVEAPEVEETVDDTPIDTSEEDDDLDEEAGDEIETVDVEDVEIDYSSITDWKSLQFSKIESEDSQTEKLVTSSVEYIDTVSRSISPPTTNPNEWYLVLKVNNFKDLTGEEYPNEYETFGIYNIAKKYTLTYDDNGGNGCSSNKKEFLLGRGESEDWGELCTPERENYVFAEWNTKSDGTGTTITENTPVTSNLKIYAKWSTARVIIRYKLMSNEAIAASTSSTATPPVNYKWRRGSGDLIERSTNGGSSYSVIASTLASGKNRQLDLTNYNNSHYLKITSKAGYTKARSGAEWICESGCKKSNQTFSHNKITISDTDSLCDTSHGDCTINIKVNWDPSSIAAIPVSLDQQGGSGGTSAIYSKNSKWYTTGNPTSNTKNITSITKPSKTGNGFEGYYSDKNGKGTQKIKADGTISAGASGVTSSSTWFAKWTLNTCTIKFSPNGGTFNNNANKTTQALQYGKSVSDFWNANGGTYKATRTGYTITSSKAWLLSGTTKTFDETKGYKATQICTSLASKNQTVTLKANWQAKKVAVTFNCNGGSGGGSQTFTYGISNQKFSKTCARSGYIFQGWSASKTATRKTWSIANNVSDNWINNNSPKITIYAVWATPSKPYYTSDNREFDYLQDAINNTSSGKTIYLSRNYNDGNGATLNTAGKTLTFNVNGHMLNLTGNSIEVKAGTLTIVNGSITTNKMNRSVIKANGNKAVININNSSNQKIDIINQHISDTLFTEEVIRIENGGTVNVRGSNTIIKSGAGSSSGYSRIVSIETGGGTFNMFGGTLIGDATKAGYGGSTGINSENSGNINFSGGTIYLKKLSSGTQCVFCGNRSSKVRVTGGTIKIDSSDGRGCVFWTDSSANSLMCYQKGSVVLPSKPTLTFGNVKDKC